MIEEGHLPSKVGVTHIQISLGPAPKASRKSWGALIVVVKLSSGSRRILTCKFNELSRTIEGLK